MPLLVGYSALLWSMQADGPALSNTTTATSLINSGATTNPKYTLPAGYFRVPGDTLRLRGAGRFSNVVTSQHTLTLDVRLGAVIAFNGGVMTPSTTAHTNVPIEFEILLTCRAVGSGTAANLMGQGRVFSQAFVSSGATADGANTHTMLMIPNTAPAVGTGFDSSVAQTVDLFGTWGAGVGASDSITLHQLWIEGLVY